MIIRWEDRDWPLDFSDLTVKQAEAIEAASGMTLEKWFGQLAEDASGIKMLKCVYWLMYVQNGERLKLSEVDFPVLKFGMAFKLAADAAEDEAPAQEKKPDPTTASRRASAPSRAPSSRKASKPVVTVTGGPDG